MDPFEISLSEGRKITGLLFLPQPASPPAKGRPLIVTLHGGTYSARYYDIDAEHSIANIAKPLQVPVVCITRPGYGESTSLPYPQDGDSLIQQQGRYLHQEVLPAVWKNYGGVVTGSSSIVLQGHSIGAAVSIVAAGVFTRDATPDYPLAGLITSGIGCSHHPSSMSVREEFKAKGPPVPSNGNTAPPIITPPGVKNKVMLNKDVALPSMASNAVYDLHDTIGLPMAATEHYDIMAQWITYWDSYAADINVPHFTTFPEQDMLWDNTEEHLSKFKKAFKNCPRMETSLPPETPHCIELSHMGQAWLSRAFGYAMQCALAAELAKERALKASKTPVSSTLENDILELHGSR